MRYVEESNNSFVSIGSIVANPFNGVVSFDTKNLECKRIISTVKANQKKIRLIVRWTDSRAVQHQRAYEAYYTKEGISDYYSRVL